MIRPRTGLYHSPAASAAGREALHGQTPYETPVNLLPESGSVTAGPLSSVPTRRDQTPGIAFLSGFRRSVKTTAITSAIVPRMMKNDDCLQMDQ